jgi:hypothetical protein
LKLSIDDEENIRELRDREVALQKLENEMNELDVILSEVDSMAIANQTDVVNSSENNPTDTIRIQQNMTVYRKVIFVLLIIN